MKGIYCYRDLNNHDKIIYIGKDSNIDKNKRHNEHMAPSKYDEQVINRVLQNNPDRYDYEVLIKGDISEKILNGFEKSFIRMYDPKFCFTDGGEGISGWHHSEEAKRKMSIAQKGENHWNYGGHLSEEHKQKISKANKGMDSSMKGKKHSEKTKKKMSINNGRYWEGKTFSEDVKNKLSKSHLKYWEDNDRSEYHRNKLSELHKIKYARIIKCGKIRGKQLYGIIRDGKIIRRSTNPSKLLEWFTKEFPKEILLLKQFVRGVCKK